jgi:hypothetical protein
LQKFGVETENAIPASICARNVVDRDRPDFGYRPAIAALVDRLKEQLVDRCLPRQLDLKGGDVPCGVVEVTTDAEACTCDGVARGPASERLAREVKKRLDCEGAACDAYCLCEILPTTDEALLDCRTNSDTGPSTNGWCYVDPGQNAGSAALVEECPPTERQTLRFVGTGQVKSGATAFISCIGRDLH